MTGQLLRACNVCGRPTANRRKCPSHTSPDPRKTFAYQRARLQVLAEEHVCWICGQPAARDDPLTADHIIPVASGGSNDRRNLRAAHRSCNSRRGIGRGEEVPRNTAVPPF